MVVGEFTQETDLLVIGGGPGGYTAAFQAARLGIPTTIVDADGTLGGVCLHRGCIPSKALLNIAETLHLAEVADAFGVTFEKPRLDLEKMRRFTSGVVEKLTKGLDGVAARLGVERLHGRARFEDGRHASIQGGSVPRVRFRRALIATGSRPIRLEGIEVQSPRVIDSTGALDLPDVPGSLLVIGAGYIGLELGQVYAALGSEVTVVEMLPRILPGADRDLVRPLERRLKTMFAEVAVNTRVTAMQEAGDGVEVTFEGKKAPARTRFDRVLVAVGRVPNVEDLGLEHTGVELDPHGFIRVDRQFRTADRRIFALGDVIGNPMLAHKAVHEGKVVADVLAGRENVYDARAVPAVVFTDPEVAWAGLTEEDAKAADRPVVAKKIPWTASGRATAIGRANGMTKILFDPESGDVLGVGMTGPHAGEMIAEGVLAIEMGATDVDLAETIHPHPTLSEMIGEVADLMAHERRERES
jgi:dihydrolipoamide dehydrogenase